MKCFIKVMTWGRFYAIHDPLNLKTKRLASDAEDRWWLKPTLRPTDGTP